MGKTLSRLAVFAGLFWSAQRLLISPTGKPLPSVNGRPDGARGTALITGASSGIGAAFATLLAARGYSLVLTARRREKLQALADALEQQHGVSVEVLPADLANIADIEQLAERVAEINDLTILINNAGFGTDGSLAQSTAESQVSMLNVHNRAPMRLTQAALLGMIARSEQAEQAVPGVFGAVINVSSVAAMAVLPNSANYAATKAFLNSFSLSVQPQVAKHGIAVQALCPGFTYTEFHDSDEYANFDRNRLPDIFWMSAEEVASESLNALGSRVVFVPGAVNRVIAGLMGPISSNPLLQKAQRKILGR